MTLKAKSKHFLSLLQIFGNSSRYHVIAITRFAWRVSKYGVFFGPNAEKYGPEKNPYLDTFHAVKWLRKRLVFLSYYFQS